jgi:VWFA-related protein
MLPRAIAFIGACVAAVCVTTLIAQDSRPAAPQEPTFRTGTQSVRVDLYATVNGVPLTDLRREEIRLLEDGAPQTIQAFERITFTAPSAILPAEPKTLEDSRRLAIDPHTRLFVLFLPTADAGFDLGPTGEARRLLVEPLNPLLGEDDLIAVMTPYTRIVDLTFHRRVPLNDSRFLSNDDIADPKHRLWDACYPPMAPGSPNAEMKARHSELRTFEALDALVDHLGGLREERKQVLIVTDGFRLFTENPGLAAKGQRAPLGFPVGRGPEAIGTFPKLGQADAFSTEHLRECEQDLGALASINHSNRLQELAQHASRNNVSFTPVSLARMQTGRGVTGTAGSRMFENATSLALQSSLRGLAEGTGGTAIVNTNDISGNLRNMLAATSAFYLLGYTPTNAALDGRFRRIEVRIDRPGVRVHARPGYVAAKAPPDVSRVPSREAAKPPGAIASAVAAIAGWTDNEALHIRTATWVRADADGKRASATWVVGELGTTQRAARRPTSPLSAQLVIQPPGSGPLISKRLELSVGASFDFELAELSPGDHSALLTVTGDDSGTLRETVRIAVPEEATTLGEPILLRRSAETGLLLVRTANPSFRRNERLQVDLPTTGTLPVTATLRDSKGTALSVPVTLTERPDSSGSWRWISAAVPLAPFAPAVYAIELTQGAMSRAVAFRVIP